MVERAASPLRIALLCPGYLRVGGGSVLYARRLGEELQKRGHALTVVTDRTPDAAQGALNVAELDRDAGAETQAQRSLRIESVRGGHRLGRWLFRNGETRLLASGPICPALDSALPLACDVAVLVNASTAWTVHLGRFLSTQKRPPVVVVPLLHTRDEWSSWPTVLHLLDQCAGVIGLTSHEGRFLAERQAGCAPFAAIPAGSDVYDGPVDAAGFRRRHGIPAHAPIVLFLGRKVLGKGVAHVVQAMDRVWDRFPDARLVLAGFAHNGPEWIQGYLAASRHGPAAAARTVDLDDVTDAERESALEACSVMAAPSVNDSFGIVYLDAWRHQKPVLACCDAPAANFIADGRDGLLVPFGDVRAIGLAIEELLYDEAAARVMGHEGFLAWKAGFQWPQIAERVEGFLHGVLS